MTASAVPDLAIIGAPKSGTTSLAYWLQEREDVLVPTAKELRFLDQYWDRGVEWYEQQFEPRTEGTFTVEATPTYLAHAEAPARAAVALPSTRFLAILRDPIERAWSHHWFAIGQRGGDAAVKRPFLDIVEEEVAAGLPDDGILTHGRYAHHLERWAAAVPPDRIRAITLDDMSADPVATFRWACEYLGAPTEPVPEGVAVVHNQSNRIRSVGLWGFMLRHRLHERLPRRLARAVDSANRETVENPPIPPEVTERLTEVYADDVARLAPRWLTEVPAGWPRR